MRNCKWLSIVLLLVCTCKVNAMFAMPQNVPVDRLIKNTTAFIKENPKNAHGYYTLARIHYLAFINKSDSVGTFNADSLPPEVAPDWLLGNFAYHELNKHARMLLLKEYGYSSVSEIKKDQRDEFWNKVNEKNEQLKEQGWGPEKLSNEELVNHAALAVDNFEKAILLDPENALYHLGLGSLLEQYVTFLKDRDIEEMPEQFRAVIIDKAKSSYYTAYTLSIRKDLRHKNMPLQGLASLAGYEAGNAYVRLSKGEELLLKAEKKRISKIQKDIKKLEALPFGAITPIVLSFEKHLTLSDLLVPGLEVAFDLDGDGAVELWPWVKPTTGILVWDHDGKGQIKSGRQLFGSVSWWLFFADGYHALDALDDSRDGVLSGRELERISVWFDGNSNGKSDAGDVVPIKDLNIVSLATKSTGYDNGCPMNKAGLGFKNGDTLPTYDWITSASDNRVE